MMLRSALALLALACVLFLTPPPCPAAPTYTFGLATGLGGLGDKSFNDMQHSGMILARNKYGIDYHVGSPSRVEDDERVLRELIAMGANAILCGGGWHMKEPVDKLAREHPEVLFVLLDDTALSYPPNVASITFRQNEGSYLAGVLAAGVSKTGRVAFLGAIAYDVIRDFHVGYRAGALAAKPTTDVVERYIALDTGEVNPFLAPLRARRMALELYDENCDVVFAVAAGSNKGVFQAAKEREAYAIGVDSDQDHIMPGYILTSMMKRLDEAIFFIVGAILDGSFENRNYSLGLAENGVSLTPMTFTRLLIPTEVLQEVETYRQGIINGAITVPSAFER